MKHVFLLAASLALAACASSNAGTYDEPDDRVVQTGSHIPVKDKSAGKATNAGDANAMIQNQKAGNPNAGAGAR